ncbi:MarR family transcriptional regulator [Streptomyces mangrovisoli]|uniref:MarR family winged helix-turn-helix transcriptional regulator n=1 Tax=Streptomyces mangrovisoli TaxID=1428628 RepID=UPI0009A0BCA0
MSTAPEGATPGFLVWRLSMKWRVAVDRAVAPLGLTHAQYSLVASLYGMQRSGLRPSQRRLADHTGLEPLYVSKLARALESAGLVERTRDPKDPRAVQLTLTEQGRDTTKQAIGVVQGLLGQLLAPLGGLDSVRTKEFTRELTTLLDAPLDPFSAPLDLSNASPDPSNASPDPSGAPLDPYTAPLDPSTGSNEHEKEQS